MIYPPDFTHPKDKTVAAHVAARMISDLVSQRRAVVQAGGCAGLWPLALSMYFDRVYTCEPDPTNFKCLWENIAETPSISAFQCAIGETYAHVGLTRPKAKAGLWRVDGDGDIPMLPLDDILGPIAVDAIVLDVEGYEAHALKGAERLITENHPLLWFEYNHNQAEIDSFLVSHGYAPAVQGVGGDKYSLHASMLVHT